MYTEYTLPRCIVVILYLYINIRHIYTLIPYTIPIHYTTIYYTYSMHSLAGFQKIPTCEDRYGWTYIDKWLNNIHIHLKSKTINKHSNIKCIIDYKTSNFCQYKHIILDFSKSHIGFANRNFLTGFFNTYRTIGDTYYKAIDMQIPGIQVHTLSYNDSIYTQCDIVEDEPVFIISHDDVYNLGISYVCYTSPNVSPIIILTLSLYSSSFE